MMHFIFAGGCALIEIKGTEDGESYAVWGKHPGASSCQAADTLT